MAQMGAMSAAGGAAMGTMAAATTGSLPLITIAFQAVGLGFLLVLPFVFYQILLIVVLGLTIFSSYYSYRFHKKPGPFSVTIVGSLLLYSSIYFLAYEPLYWIAFIIMLLSTGWSYVVTRKEVPRPLSRKLVEA